MHVIIFRETTKKVATEYRTNNIGKICYNKKYLIQRKAMNERKGHIK